MKIAFSNSFFSLQEVILERASAEEKLGLTLFYAPCSASTLQQPEGADERGRGAARGDEPSSTTEVLVSQIEAGSAAAKDGRIRIGDQILQVRKFRLLILSHRNRVLQKGKEFNV